MVSRQVVVGPGLGYLMVDRICLVGFCERGKEETGLLFTGCVWVGLVVSGRKREAGYIGTHVAPKAQQWGLMLEYIALFQS